MKHALAALAFALLPLGAQAQGCRLALSLALDVSSSVNSQEYALQVDGLASALTAPEVEAAFLAVPGQPVALHIYEWSGRDQQSVRHPWIYIRSPADLQAVASHLRSQERSHADLPTALGFAMGFGAIQLKSRTDCLAHTLDVSGDGTNNEGFPPIVARREFAIGGITVNGLVIGQNRVTLQRYFEQNVIQGPGAFVETATGYDDFERAMKRKLLRELSAGALSFRDENQILKVSAPEPGNN